MLIIYFVCCYTCKMEVHMFRKLLSSMLVVMLVLTGIISPRLSSAQEHNIYMVAVLDLEANGVSTIEAKGLSEKIRTRISWLVNNPAHKNNPGTDKYSVVERSQMDKILDQFNIQSAVCTDISCAVEFGKMFQADRIIIGSVNLIGSTYNITTRMIDIESAQSLSVSEVDYRGSIDGLLGSRIQDVADELLLGCTFRDWEKLENISVFGTPGDATISINGKKAGIAPITNRMVPARNVTVEIQKHGYENHREKISLRKGEPVQFAYTLFPKTRGQTIIKSIYYPGSGQRYAEHKGKGYLITLAQLATIAGVVETTLLSMEAQQDYDDAKDVYSNSASPDEFDRTYKILEEKYDTSKQAQTYQLISAGAVLTVYIYNLIDAALTEPNIDKGFGEKRLFMEPRMTHGYSSITVSLRF